jgi:hypothetical protein
MAFLRANKGLGTIYKIRLGRRSATVSTLVVVAPLLQELLV